MLSATERHNKICGGSFMKYILAGLLGIIMAFVEVFLGKKK